MTVTPAPRADSPAADMTIQILYRSTGDATATVDESGVMHFLLQLHTDMFLGLPGMLFLGLMRLLFVIAIVSGVVLYATFMRKLDFGHLPTARSHRIKWPAHPNLHRIVALTSSDLRYCTDFIHTLQTPT